MHPNLSNDTVHIQTTEPIEAIEVYDFHTVDYEALVMLNVSATQALLKRIEDLENQNLKKEEQITTLKASNEELKMEQNQIKNRLDKIEAIYMNTKISSQD